MLHNLYFCHLFAGEAECITMKASEETLQESVFASAHL